MRRRAGRRVARHAGGRARTPTRPSSRCRTRSAIRSDLVTGEDLFVIAEQSNADGSVYFRVLREAAREPDLARGLVFLLGSLIALWPDAREQRRLAVRYARGRASRRRVTRRARPRRAARGGVRRPRRAAVPARADAGRRPARRAGRARAAALELAEERDRALAALKELEFDHRTGKVSDEDYRALVGPLRREAAAALRALEPRAEVDARANRAEPHAAGRAPMEPLPIHRRHEPVAPEPEPAAGANRPSRRRCPEPYPPPGELDPPAAGRASRSRIRRPESSIRRGRRTSRSPGPL